MSGGCEAAVHSCRLNIDNLSDGHVIAKLDFTNAFNCLHRDTMLDAVYSTIPDIYAFCYLSYSDESILKFADRHICSQEGIQQGDPLGPLLFCLTIHPILSSLSSNFIVGYMDDVTIGGPASTVADDVNIIINSGISKGLHLNIAKCELISNSEPTSITPIDQFLNVSIDNATLLGAPLSTGHAMDSALDKKLLELQRASERLQLISSHDALVLLKASCGASKLMHVIRSSPCQGHRSLSAIDTTLRTALSNIVNINIADNQWIQASLPVKAGGLGIRSVSSIASSAFLASVSSTVQLHNLLLSRCQFATLDNHFDAQLTDWSVKHQPTLPPAGKLANKQSSWDKHTVEATYATLLDA